MAQTSLSLVDWKHIRIRQGYWWVVRIFDPTFLGSIRGLDFRSGFLLRLEPGSVRDTNFGPIWEPETMKYWFGPDYRKIINIRTGLNIAKSWPGLEFNSVRILLIFRKKPDQSETIIFDFSSFLKSIPKSISIIRLYFGQRIGPKKI